MPDGSWKGCGRRSDSAGWVAEPTPGHPPGFTGETWKVKLPKGSNAKMQFMEAGGVHTPKERVRNNISTKDEQVPPSLALRHTREVAMTSSGAQGNVKTTLDPISKEIHAAGHG